MKSMNSPIVSVPAITSRPPSRSTAAIPSGGEEEQSGEVVRLDGRLAHRLVRAPPRPGRGSACGRRPRVRTPAPSRSRPRPRRCLGQIALPRLHEPRDREEPVREEPREDGDRRHRKRREEREPRVHGGEDDPAPTIIIALCDALHDAPADEVAHRIDVVRGPRDHLAGRVPVEERARIAEVGVVEHSPQPRLDARSRPALLRSGARS